MSPDAGGQDIPFDAEAIRRAADARHYSWWWHLNWWFRMTGFGRRLTNWELDWYEDDQTRQYRLAELARALLAENARSEVAGQPLGASVPDELISHPQSFGQMRGELS